MTQLAEPAAPRPAAARTVALGGGRRVPYPVPTDEAATKVGRANRRTDTRPEIALRSALHRQGLRFRKDYLIRVDGVRVKPDIVFTRLKLAVFVDGCFWHSCPEHGTVPGRNRDYWVPKLIANSARDARANLALRSAGWRVERIWEHEAVEVAAERIDRMRREIQAAGA